MTECLVCGSNRIAAARSLIGAERGAGTAILCSARCIGHYMAEQARAHAKPNPGPEKIGFQITAGQRGRAVDISQWPEVRAFLKRDADHFIQRVYWVPEPRTPLDVVGVDASDLNALYFRDVNLHKLLETLQRQDQMFVGAISQAIKENRRRLALQGAFDDDNDEWERLNEASESDESDSTASSSISDDDNDDEPIVSSTYSAAAAAAPTTPAPSRGLKGSTLNPLWPWDPEDPLSRLAKTTHSYTDAQLKAFVGNTEYVRTTMEPFRTELKGQGVRAIRDLRAGEFLTEYTGDLLLSEQEIERRREQYAHLNRGIYLIESSYYGRGGRALVFAVDATMPEMCQGNELARLMNHSRAARNVLMRVIVLNRQPHMMMFALRPIQRGEELLFNYDEQDPSALEDNPRLRY